jgi:hypothetical protein
MIKLATFRGVSEEGEPLVRLFDPGVSLVKQAGEMMPQVREWLDAYQPDPNKIAILVNALGASEYWGQNVNGDVFPESALLHDCNNHPSEQHPYDDFTGKVIPPYGAWTFMMAHPFVHHQNKDPNRAFGKVVLWAWNPRMHRVELVILLDKKLALQHGAQHVIDRILAGEFADVSMGCFRAGTLILMGDGGQKTIEDVEIGDEVITHLGQKRAVTDVMVRDHRSIFKLKAYGHKEQWVTGEHPLWLARREEFDCHPFPSLRGASVQRICTPNSHEMKKGCSDCATRPDYEFKWVPVEEAREGDYLASPIPKFKEPKRLLSRAEARLVGYYLAEGHPLRTKAGNLRGVQFSTGLHEKTNHLDIYLQAEHLGLEDNFSEWDDLENNGKYISLWGAPDLAHLCVDMCGEKASSKFFSEELLAQPPEILLEVLGAYTNGDGGIYDGSVYFSTCSGPLAQQLMLASKLCGLIPSLNVNHHRPSTVVKKNTIEYQVWVGTDTSWKLTTTWKDTRRSEKLSSKRFFYERNGTTWLLTPIEELEKHQTNEKVYNFSVEEHESYVAGGLAVHNCKVPYDICTICGHKSKTRKDYCNCIRFIGMNKILDDGRRIGVINTYPRFFDISFVFIGADKTAKVMCKLGSSGLWVPQSILDAEEVYGIANEDGEELTKAASIQVPSNLYMTKHSTLNTSLGAGTVGVDLGAETLDAGPADPPPYLSGRVDAQENYERRAISDGALKTNADVNETDEFPEPLMPGRGKTASPLKQIFHDAREKTAGRFSAFDKAFTAVLNSRLGRAGIGAAVGGATAAGLSDEERLKAGLIGAGTGAAAGLGTSFATRGLGGRGGAKIFGPQVDKLTSMSRKIGERGKKILEQQSIAAGRRDDLLAIPKGSMEPAQAKELHDLQTKVIPGVEQQLGKWYQQVADVAGKLRALNPPHEAQQAAMKALGGGVGAVVGGAGAGALTAEAFQKQSSEETGQYGGMGLVWKAAQRMKIGPPPKPNRKEHPFTGTINFRGLVIHVENKPGTIREGKGWKTKMRLAYGEFLGSRGVDKDKLDVYVGPYRKAPNVYIIHQNFVRGPNKGKYDEDKVMLGFESLEQAKLAYLAHYDNPKFFRSATVMAFPVFKRALLKKEVHGEKVASVFVHEMEKRADELKLEDAFNIGENHSTRSKVWRHSDGRELRRSGSGMESWGQTKQASVEKYAALEPQDILKVSNEKWADIVKHIGPDKAVGKVSPILSDSEPTLPRPALDAMSSKGMESALATPSMMGMVLKPEEFQRICLNCMGKGPLADKLDDAGAVFKPSEGEMAPCQGLDSSQLRPDLMKMLLPLMGEKSYFGPVVRRRIIRISVLEPKPLTKSTEVNSPLLSKVASAYNWYRREQMKLAADAMKIVPEIPELHSGLYGIEDADLFSKSAAKGVDATTLAVVLGSIPITLMWSAHLRGKQRKGEDVGTLKGLVADHPWLATIGTAAALREIMKAPRAKQAVSEIMAAGKRIWKGAPAPVAG